MKLFGKSEPKKTPRETTAEEEAEARLRFHTASARFGPVGRRDKTWKTSSE
ncbi:hypothetical protein SEA_BEUFFERT_119 [Streptomyces phage Beuffert]|nr:hypothetical protein SEA_BEUFFERT_119 [Streptomyces phage Beuffert]